MDDHTIPATKADMTMLMDSIGKLYDANEKWKDDIMRHFDVTVEKIRHDLLGANRDEISLLKDAKEKHEKRIMRLEEHAGLVSMT